ncbi:MAG TPA: hypothetical protein VK854_03425 [Woeseiaceae bacterium]|nr:hypothetical protein [Woeseiaceae bacterium]
MNPASWSLPLLSGAFLLYLLAIHVGAVAIPTVSFLGIHAATLLIVIACFFGLYVMMKTHRAPMWIPRQTGDTRPEDTAYSGRSKESMAKLWLVFSAALFLAERGVENSPIQSLGDAMYWGIAALSTAGIADSPISGLSKLIGGAWIIIGSVMFFGIIVSTVTAYFMRPVQRPTDRLVESIESSLEELDQLTLDELDLLKENVDNLIEHMEEIQSRRH